LRQVALLIIVMGSRVSWEQEGRAREQGSDVRLMLDDLQ
jgi:hypothetical protein